MSMSKKDHPDCSIMGRALGIPDSGLLVPRESMQLVDPNEPFDKLLSNRRFRQSFMEFADRYSSILLLFFFFFFSFLGVMILNLIMCCFWYSCLAGESVHFYEEVQQLDKIAVSDHVRRIYMARHIIDTYITPGIIVFIFIQLLISRFSILLRRVCVCVFFYIGATMEVNISHHCRQEILSTLDLAHPDLFNNALNELIQLMKMVSLFTRPSFPRNMKLIYFLTQLIFEEFGE